MRSSGSNRRSMRLAIRSSTPGSRRICWRSGLLRTAARFTSCASTFARAGDITGASGTRLSASAGPSARTSKWFAPNGWYSPRRSPTRAVFHEQPESQGHDAAWPQDTTVCVTFTERAGRTVVTLEQDVSERLAKRTGAHPSWLQMLDRLRRRCGSPDAMTGASSTCSDRRSRPAGHPVNGIDIYYEVHGSRDGIPLVLLHGGGSTIDSNFGRVLPFLARNRRVIALEEQGHGRTSDRDQPVTFEGSADDVAGLLRYLKVPQADLLGFSNGGTVALQVAIRHPAARPQAGVRVVPHQTRGRAAAAVGVHRAGGHLQHAAGA